MGLVLTFLSGRSAVRAQATGDTVGVYYVGPEDQIAVALDRAGPFLVRVDQPDLAQVIVINNAPLRESLEVFSAEIQQERVGLVLFCGNFFPQQVDDLRLLLGFSTFGLDQTAAPSPVEPGGADDVLGQAITWRSAPELRARTLITNPNLLRPVVTTPDLQGIIQRVRGRDQTQALIVGAWLSHPANELWQDWAYFDYLVYRLIADAAGADRILSYVDYPLSPAPERTLRWGIVGAGVGFLLAAGAIYYSARRRLYLHPELSTSWERLTAPAMPPSRTSGDRAAVTQAAIAQGRQETSEAGRPAVTPETAGADLAWKEAGFHRPLAGFLTYLPLGLIVTAPLLFYQLRFLPDILMTDSLGYEAWQTVSRWTLALWTVLDAGVGVAAVRYYAMTRRHWPSQAVKYIQFYVWWQFLSGAVQVGLIAILTVVALPVFGLAHFSYYLLARALLQFPGFLQVFTIAFRARQRFDYEQLLILFGQLITPLLQIGFVGALQPWAQASLEISAGISGAFGLAAGLLVGQALTFLVGVMLHRREGEPLSSLFLPTFNARTSSEILRFGVPWSIGAAMPAVGAVVLLLLLNRLLAQHNTTPTAWFNLIEVTAMFEILLTSFYWDLMPALSEAAAFRYKTLLRYYVSQAIRYGGWFSFYLFGLISALGPVVISLFPLPKAAAPAVSAAPAFLEWLVPLAAWGALRWAAWLPDRMLEAAGKPGAVALLATVEQILRIAGAYGLLRLGGSVTVGDLDIRLGLAGLPAAYAIALLVRIILGRWLGGRYLVKARTYVWQSLIVPGLAGLIIYQLLQVGVPFVLPGSWQGAAVLAVGLALPVLLAYGFVTAMLGGWDDGGLADFRKAMRISGIGRPFAWLLYEVIALGARFSPLHGRFPMMLYELAQNEAQALTFARSQEQIVGE